MFVPRTFVLRSILAILAIFLAGPARAQAPDHLCDPANEDCRDILIRTIRAEQVGIDVAFWFMEDQWYADELIKKWNDGIPVRILMDSRATATYPRNGPILTLLKNAGIPMRERFTGGILHWKMMLFSGQNIVQFSGANYSPDAWMPLAMPLYSNYVDEAILFTGKASLVNSFRTKYDDLWLNTLYYRDYANITGPPAREYGIFPQDPELNFAPWESYANRATKLYNHEAEKIDVIMFRITDQRHTNAMIAAHDRGIPVRLISEPMQYRDPTRLWHSWNIDRMYMAGIPIKHRKHAGLNHQKTVILYDQDLVINGSSNWSSASAESQEEHNLFTHEPWIFQWFVDQFERKWNNSTGVLETENFVPLPPAQPLGPIPQSGTTSVPTANLTLQWEGGFFAHIYDVYLGTTSNPPLIGSNLPLGPSAWIGARQSLTLQTELLPGTTYYWRIVGKTMANMTAASNTWTFTTAGSPPGQVTVARGPYLQQVTSTAATVVWATNGPGQSEVRATAAGGATTTASATTTLYASSATGLTADYYQHEARLTGLTPSTTYGYDLFVGGVDKNPQADQLTTAPAAGTGSLTFVAFGDSGTGSAEQRQIAGQLESQSFDLMLHAGDVAYGDATGVGAGTHQTLNDWFFSIYANTLRGRAVFPSMGNHDSRTENANGRPYLDMFVLPTNGGNTGAFPDHAERYYSFDYGPVHVVVLDTELAFQDVNRRAAQLAWLDADLSATTQPWKVALFHRSPFSAGGEHGSDLTVRAAFAPVFERRGVQVALSAHEHDYERTQPWKIGSDPNGTPVTYIVTGGGGGPLYPAGTDTWTAVSASRHHYVRGTATTCTLTVDAIGTDGSTFDTVSLSRCEPVPDTQPPTAAITAPAPGATVQGNVSVTATATDNVGVTRVELFVDGSSVAQDTTAPYAFTWSSASVANGSHQLMVRAFDAAGNSGDSGTVQVTANNPSSGAGDIVLYAADATVIRGAWLRQNNAQAAGGTAMRNPNAGAPKKTVALAAPLDYFELTFQAQANVPYHLWIRSKADDDYWGNDSVFVQFSGATDYAIGTTAAADMNLEDCSGCGISGWGWQDNGWGVGVSGPHIVFTSTGTHTIRIQTREDGLSIDQIMLSPSGFLTQSPGALKNDSNIYPRSTDTTPDPDTQPPVTAISAPGSGASVSGTATVTATATDNVGVTRVELWVDGALGPTDTSSPYSFSWNTGGLSNGSHTLQSRAYDAAGLTGSSAIVTVTVSNGPPPDTQAPVTSITAPSGGATVSGTATVTATATDNVGVTRVELWVDGALRLTDTSSPYSFSWITGGLSNGSHTLQSRAYDAAGLTGSSAIVTVTVSNGPPPDTQAPVTSITAPSGGATVSGTTSVTAAATDNVGVTRVELWVDGALRLTDTSSPYSFSWITGGLSNGSHTLQSRAYDAAGLVGMSAIVTVTVTNTTPPGPQEIVLYASDASVIVGRWKREADASAAGGFLMHHPNQGIPKLAAPLANPTDYFELTFTAQANVPYHLWARIKAEDNTWPNESVFMQFSSGTPYTIGTTAGADVNLENCNGCGVSGWGWQDNGWGAQLDGPNITFSTGGAKTIRVQTREDGTYIDQIVLSPATYLAAAPGPLKNDNTKLPKQ